MRSSPINRGEGTLWLMLVADRFPAWVEEAVSAYLKRLPPLWQLQRVLIKPEKRCKSLTAHQALEREGKRLLDHLPPEAFLVALHEKGHFCTSFDFAKLLERWRSQKRWIAFAIGSADGLDAQVLARAQFLWSLSPMTLPHELVHVVVVEQIYRAYTILKNHPYHRA